MTLIREAEQTDLPALVGLSELFISSTAYREFPATLATLEHLFARIRDLGEFFVAEVDGQVVGFLALVLVPHLLTGEPYADEIAWFVHPDHRRGTVGPRLLKAGESWALQNRAKLIRMIAPEGSDVGRYYQRVGYRPVETTYIKRFDPDQPHGGIHDDGASDRRRPRRRRPAGTARPTPADGPPT